MYLFYIFIQISILCISSCIKHHIPTKLIKHTNIFSNNINKSFFHVGTMITIASTIFSTTTLLLPLSSQVAHAVGPTQVQLSITSYKAVELCDGRKPIMPGQKAMEGGILMHHSTQSYSSFNTIIFILILIIQHNHTHHST